MGDILYFVIPCYNEQEVLRETAKRLREKLRTLIAANNISEKSRVVFVNDGSKEMISKYKAGFDVVYGVRSKRKTDTFFKRFTAESFYKLIRFLGADVVNNHADYRLMSISAILFAVGRVCWLRFGLSAG